MKYTPPPKFKGKNLDRDFTDFKEEPKPISNMFPLKEKPKEDNHKEPKFWQSIFNK